MIDFLIIGSGIAGLSFALKAANLGKVVIITKKNELDSATNLAQGGIAAVLSKDDSFDLHIADTLRSGAGLCDTKVVDFVVKEGPERVEELIEIGVNFVQDSEKNELSLGKEGGHSRRRVAHSYDLTGKEIERALLDTAKKNPNISILENHFCIDLVLDQQSTGAESKKCLGAYVLYNETVELYSAKVTILCTGGSGKVYLYTSNPDIATGDGIAMAFRAGAEIANMEFIQFHPTCLYHPKAKNFLISEAVRGEGAYLIDKDGNRFMSKYDPERMELATRDTVARAIDKEMKETGAECVFLDLRHKNGEYIRNRFPNIHAFCLNLGIDITKHPIPVVPAAHYLCGGVLSDQCGRSTIPNLFVLGETACTGLHGGNRLASNSLLEAIVFAERAYQYCREHWQDMTVPEITERENWKSGKATQLQEKILINHNWELIRKIMWNYVGIVRNNRRLLLADQRITEILIEIEQMYNDFMIIPSMIELRNISYVSKLIIQAARLRTESVGLHFTSDYPDTNEFDRHWNIFKKSRKTGLGYIEPELIGRKNV